MRNPRQALLRPDSAGLYPDIPPGVWLPASRVAFVLARRVARAHRLAGSLPSRILDEQYFEFAGGPQPERPQHVRSRATDQVRGATAKAGRIVARCEGCGVEIALMQDGPLEGILHAPALRDFLHAHEACRQHIRLGPFFSLSA